MARKRPSIHKREREYQKRQRELKKAAKAAQKRERRFGHGASDAPALADEGPTAAPESGETAD